MDTVCENCGNEMPIEESQKCDKCGMDGLGNCCIGDLDHECKRS